MTATKAILFCRVSSKEQEDTGYSLDAQEKLLTEYAQKQEFNIAKVFKISESASGKQIRTLFNEMLQYVLKHNINVICVEKIDRLTRNLTDAAVISDWIQADERRYVHFVKENFVAGKNTRAHENLVWDMKVAIARFYTNNLSEEVRKGQKEKIAQGWLPTKPPLGYKTIGDKGHKIHVIDDEKGPFIRKMFEYYSTNNYSVNALVTLMFNEGLRNRVGKQVGKSRMNDLLSDPFYVGKLRWKGVVSPAKHEPLISTELFNTVQTRLNRKNKTDLQFKKHNPVFKGKIICQECEGLITWEIQKGHWYGHCNHYKNCSQSVWWRQEKVEDVLFPLFDNVAPKSKRILGILEKALKETHVDEVDYYNKSIAGLKNELQRNQRRLDAIYVDKIDGKITADFYNKKLDEYSKAATDAEDALKRLNNGNMEYYRAGYAIHELASRAADIYRSPKATIDDKRLLLSKVFSNLSLDAHDIKPNYSLAFQFLREWMPKLNETFEPTQKAAKGGSLRGVPVKKPTSRFVESSEPRNHFRTSENPYSTVRFDPLHLKSGSLLRG